MPSPEHESFLPRVEEADLLALVFEDVVDPGHHLRWQRFASANPRLAGEVLKRAFAGARDTFGLGLLERQKVIMDIATFVVQALEQATIRIAIEKAQRFSDGDDGEVPPLSA